MQRKFSTVLITPAQGLTEVYGKYSKLASTMPALGPCALAAYLIHHHYPVRIIDADVLRLTSKEVGLDISNEPADLVGIYTHSVNYNVVRKLVSAIKQVNKSQKIVVGGPHLNFAQVEALEENEIEFAAKGEGEETLLELVQHLEDGATDFSEIDGLAWKAVDGEIIVNKDRVRKKELDTLPFPAIHLLPPISMYHPPLMQYKRLPVIDVETSRGCPYRCSFCETPFGKKMSFYSPEYIADYLEHLQKKIGVKEVHFMDDTFTLVESRVFELCELINKRKIKIPWYCAARVDIKNRDIWKTMQKAGCWIVAIGVESGNQEIIHNLQKRITIAQVKGAAADIRKAGLALKAFFIIGNPGETLDTIEETISVAEQIKAHYPVFSLMTPYPGTPLWETADQWGTLDKKGFDKYLLAADDPVFVPFGLTKEILLAKQKEAFRRNYFNLGMVSRQLGVFKGFQSLVKIPLGLREAVRLQLNWY